MLDNEKKKILIVDDDLYIRNLCSDVLISSGYETREAQDGAQALERIRQEWFGLVITDVHMPVMGGIMLYSEAVKECAHLKERFLFMTGEITEGLLLTFSQSNFKYLWKPFKMADLVNCVDAMTMRNYTEGTERNAFVRQEVRIPLQNDCDAATIDGQKILKACAVDISKSGIGLRYQGAPLIRDSFVDVDLRFKGLSLKRRSSVVWSRPINPCDAIAGLRLREAVPVELVAELFQLETDKRSYELKNLSI